MISQRIYIYTFVWNMVTYKMYSNVQVIGHESGLNKKNCKSWKNVQMYHANRTCFFTEIISTTWTFRNVSFISDKFGWMKYATKLRMTLFVYVTVAVAKFSRKLRNGLSSFFFISVTIFHSKEVIFWWYCDVSECTQV